MSTTFSYQVRNNLRLICTDQFFTTHGVNARMILKRKKRCVMSYGFKVRMRQATCVEMSGTIKLRGTQRLFPVKYLFGEAKIA